MLGTNHTIHNSTSAKAYATSVDFCRIFESDMNRLYLLAFLLTADPAAAEKCFVQGLEDSKNGSVVFREWAQSWARRAVITNAIRVVRPRPELSAAQRNQPDEEAAPSAKIELQEPATPVLRSFMKEIAAIIALPAFQRFAFVISVLEGYSNREVSLLLDCSVHELVSARTHALQQMGGQPEVHRRLAGIDASETALAEAGAAYAKQVMVHLAAPA